MISSVNNKSSLRSLSEESAGPKRSHQISSSSLPRSSSDGSPFVTPILERLHNKDYRFFSERTLTASLFFPEAIQSSIDTALPPEIIQHLYDLTDRHPMGIVATWIDLFHLDFRETLLRLQTVVQENLPQEKKLEALESCQHDLDSLESDFARMRIEIAQSHLQPAHTKQGSNGKLEAYKKFQALLTKIQTRTASGFAEQKVKKKITSKQFSYQKDIQPLLDRLNKNREVFDALMGRPDCIDIMDTKRATDSPGTIIDHDISVWIRDLSEYSQLSIAFARAYNPTGKKYSAPFENLSKINLVKGSLPTADLFKTAIKDLCELLLLLENDPKNDKTLYAQFGLQLRISHLLTVLDSSVIPKIDNDYRSNRVLGERIRKNILSLTQSLKSVGLTLDDPDPTDLQSMHWKNFNETLALQLFRLELIQLSERIGDCYNSFSGFLVINAETRRSLQNTFQRYVNLCDSSFNRFCNTLCPNNPSPEEIQTVSEKSALLRSVLILTYDLGIAIRGDVTQIEGMLDAYLEKIEVRFNAQDEAEEISSDESEKSVQQNDSLSPSAAPIEDKIESVTSPILHKLEDASPPLPLNSQRVEVAIPPEPRKQLSRETKKAPLRVDTKTNLREENLPTRNVSDKELITLLSKHGFNVLKKGGKESGKGSHTVLVKMEPGGSCLCVTVPKRDPIGTGLLQKIYKQAGLK